MAKNDEKDAEKSALDRIIASGDPKNQVLAELAKITQEKYRKANKGQIVEKGTIELRIQLDMPTGGFPVVEVTINDSPLGYINDEDETNSGIFTTPCYQRGDSTWDVQTLIIKPVGKWAKLLRRYKRKMRLRPHAEQSALPPSGETGTGSGPLKLLVPLEPKRHWYGLRKSSGGNRKVRTEP